MIIARIFRLSALLLIAGFPGSINAAMPPPLFSLDGPVQTLTTAQEAQEVPDIRVGNEYATRFMAYRIKCSTDIKLREDLRRLDHLSDKEVLKMEIQHRREQVKMLEKMNEIEELSHESSIEIGGLIKEQEDAISSLQLRIETMND